MLPKTKEKHHVDLQIHIWISVIDLLLFRFILISENRDQDRTLFFYIYIYIKQNFLKKEYELPAEEFCILIGRMVKVLICLTRLQLEITCLHGFSGNGSFTGILRDGR